MSRPSFRPRPIDLSKPLPIIKSSKDLRNEDDVVVNRALPTIATGVDPAEEQERHLKQALLASVYGDAAKKPADIPIPVFSKVVAATYPQLAGPFRRPNSYLNFDKSDQELGHATVDYDADHEDEEFATRFNKKNHSSSQSQKSNSSSRNPALSISLLEVVMDVMEKQQGAQENEEKAILPYSAMRAALASTLEGYTEANRKAVYNHWSQRRERHKHSFLRLFQKQPDPSDTNPAVAFRPRDKDAAAANGRKLNTYENFKRAQQIRDELISLRKILSTVVEREKIKANAASVQILQHRLKLVREGGPRLEALNLRQLAPSKEAVVSGGAVGCTHTVIPARGLKLPSSIPVEALSDELLEKSESAIASDSRPKKVARRTTKGVEKTKTEETAPVTVAETVRPPGHTNVDSYGFDEYGNRFLKQMRYFAGGFVTCGVGPYDHRVFSAASERNTVRELPHDPSPFSFPSSVVEFARVKDDLESRTEAARKAFEDSRIASNKASSGRDIYANVGDTYAVPPAPKRPRTTRVRGRVGRGGRIILDRVTFERERGVKAASYPASVEAGGVYTGGLPLEAAPRVVRAGVSSGGLGNVTLLQPRDLDDPTAVDEYANLVRPMRPVSQFSRGIMRPDGTVDHWPHQKGGKRGGPVRKTPGAGEDLSRDAAKERDARLQKLRALPAYSASNEGLVREVDTVSATSNASTVAISPGIE